MYGAIPLRKLYRPNLSGKILKSTLKSCKFLKL